MSAKIKYVVTQKNTLSHAVGDVIELTELQASKLVNKVRRADAPAEKAVGITKKQHDAALTECEKLRADVVQLKATNAQLSAEVAALRLPGRVR